MDNPELESILKEARLPEIPVESLEMFPRHVVVRLRQKPQPLRPVRNSPFRFAWAVGFSVCLVIAIMTGQRDEPVKSSSPIVPDTLADSRLIQETLALFPNQIRAIVENDQGLDLILSEKKDVPVSAPVYLHICDGKHCSSFVTFSGQEIQVAGQTVAVLLDARGGIILMGKTFVWSSSQRTIAVNHLKIEAKNLEPETM
ncbi:MAG TPA: hypothetical protein VNX46_08770 [Candidatus Acidoferrum sp.]|jgi:hypothetical protein|nr:hypothetical protein [Candidatus Acidoferrum sp.]